MNTVIFSVYDSNIYSSAILLTDLNAKEFKCVDTDNKDFASSIDEIYIYSASYPVDCFRLFDYFESLFGEKIDRVLLLDCGALMYDFCKKNELGIEKIFTTNDNCVMAERARKDE